MFRLATGQHHVRSAVLALASVLEGVIRKFTRIPVAAVQSRFATRFVGSAAVQPNAISEVASVCRAETSVAAIRDCEKVPSGSSNPLRVFRKGLVLRLAAACFTISTLGVQAVGRNLHAEDCNLRISVRDAATQEPLAARIYLSDANNKHFYLAADHPDGTCIKYEKQNWINRRSSEFHTTVSAHRCRAKLPAGQYELVVERGKAYLPYTRSLTLHSEDVELQVALHRWCNPQHRGWYSGDTHLHRSISELQNVILAEDLNVALPLTNWVTIAGQAPRVGNKNMENIPEGLVSVDTRHVIWPRNTEYEIFTVGEEPHTLGALFVLGHSNEIEIGVPPWRPVVANLGKSETSVLFDMDKLDWPFAMLLPTIVPNALYEISNNHVWRTEFAFREWNSRAPSYMQPPFGADEGGHRQWIDTTLGMYYTLLNCGFRLPPTAGTANGVHPVPAGFSRVYVHQPEGFDYRGWLRGLAEGRSFVTTGPMLYATADGFDAGHEFRFESAASVPLRLEVISEKPLSYGELLFNGRPVKLLRPNNEQQESGGFRSDLELAAELPRSGWFAVRFFEPRSDGQSRFVHSGPWYVEMNNQSARPRAEEKRYLISRMKTEINRSRGIVSEAAMEEYEKALAFYESLKTFDDSAEIAAQARPAEEMALERWLDNMIIDHRFNIDEIRRATGLSVADAEKAMQMRSGRTAETKFRILPYPGGRHPRIGFLDGAMRPQRETKLSVFPPWSDGGYVVVDVPEAVFSNLGLTYLAHEHIPTIWSERSIALPRLEWQQTGAGFSVTRELPNGITIRSEAWESDGAARMRLELTNGTETPLEDLRVQVCAMLKGAIGFNVQEELETVSQPPWVAVRAENSPRWIITAWFPNQRVWTNPPVPCFHSDPIFPDCGPGKTVSVEGGLWFYQGQDVHAELQRLRELGMAGT